MEEGMFKCAICKGEFKKGLSEAEASKQLDEEFNNMFIEEECEIVCDDCYKKMFVEKK